MMYYYRERVAYCALVFTLPEKYLTVDATLALNILINSPVFFIKSSLYYTNITLLIKNSTIMLPNTAQIAS